jgi:putative FmdB family regulatory protein
MPLFQYTCNNCDHDFEMLVNRGDVIVCPKCKSKRLEQQLTLPGIPQVKDAFPSSCGDPSLPPCGAPGCRRTGKG